MSLSCGTTEVVPFQNRFMRTPLQASELLRKLIASGFGGAGDSLHAELEIIGIAGVFQRGLVGDQALLKQIVERLVEGLHAVLRGPLVQSFADVAGLLGRGDALADVCGGDEYLDGRDTADAIATLDQALADDRAQSGRELETDLLLLRRRKDADDAADGLNGVEGVQGAEDHVAGFGG